MKILTDSEIEKLSTPRLLTYYKKYIGREKSIRASEDFERQSLTQRQMNFIDSMRHIKTELDKREHVNK